MRYFALVVLLGATTGCGKSEPVPGDNSESTRGRDQKAKRPVVWSSAGKEAADLGGLEFELFRVGIRPQKDKEYVEVLWLASTNVKNARYVFREWRDKPKLVDERGTEYPALRVPFDVSVKTNLLEDGVRADMYRAHPARNYKATLLDPPGNLVRNESQGVYREAIWRALYFERPPKDTTEWRLELDGSAFGVKGTFRFKIDPKTVEVLTAK